MSKGRVVITGCAGQLGSYMAEYVLENTELSVLACIRRSSNPSKENLKYLDKYKDGGRLEIIFVDITDEACISNLIKSEKPSYFINFAGNSFLANSWNSPYSHIETNFTAVVHQLEAIKNFAPSCRYFNAGSSEQFGETKSFPQNEGHPFNPRNPYGVAKSAANILVDTYKNNYSLFAVQGIFYNCESIRRSEDFLSKKIVNGAVNIKNKIDLGEKFSPILLGNLGNARDWSHAKDFCDGVWKSLNQGKPENYLFSSGNLKSVKDFVDTVCAKVGILGEWGFDHKNHRSTFFDYSGRIIIDTDMKFYRPTESFVLLGDSSKARRELGWSPRYSFEEIISEMVEDARCQTNNK